MVVGVFVFAWWSLCGQAATITGVTPHMYTSSTECDKLADPLHGRVVQPDRSVGANVTIECDQGYVYTEATWRTCSTTKEWSGTAGICKEVICSPLPPLDHGQVIHSDGTYLSTSVVTCDEGYLYDQPDRHRTCIRHNFWSGESGQCQAVSCPELGEVDHGQLVSSGRGYLDSVVVHCDAEYELTGAGVVRCGADGTWSHRLGSCLPPATSQDVLPIVLPVCLTIALAALVAVVITVIIRRCQRAKKSNSDPESEPLDLRPSTIHIHCLFTLNEELPDDISISEYHYFEDAIKEAVTNSISTDVDVAVTLVNPVNRKVFIDIVSQCALEKKDVESAIMGTTIVTGQQKAYHCRPDSVHFRDEVTNALAGDVFRKRHVTDQILDKRIDFDREYVRLDWSPETQAGDTVGRQDGGPGTHIEDDYLACRQGKEFVLIQGRAGIGKTTLVQRLMWRWANGDWATRFRALFLLNVRHLMTVNKEVDLPRLLSRYAVYKIANLSMDWLQDNQGNIGILIDGIDEIPNFKGQWQRHESVTEGAKPLDWCLSILKHDHLPETTIFVTSRPFKGMRAMGITQLREPLKVVELRGLTEEGILEYVYTNVKRGRRDFVKDTLIKNQTLLSVSFIPFYCAALCELLGQEDPSPVDLNTYTRITAFIFQMYLKRSSGKDWSGDELTTALRSISRLAHHGLVETGEDVSGVVFNKEDFEKLNLDEIAIRRMLKTGLLTEGLDAEDGDTTVEFVHLSMQELLAMCELLKRDPDHVKKTLTTLCRSEQFNMALLFLYGLAFDDRNKTIQSLSEQVSLGNQHRQNVQSVLTSPQQDVSGHLQAVQMIHESQSALVAKSLGANMFTTGVELTTKLTLVDLRSLTFLLEHNPDVKAVQMTNVDLDAVSMSEFVNFLKGNTTVQELCLVENVDSNWLQKMMEAVAENKGLLSLQLPCSNISDQMMDYVGIVLWKNKTLTNLWLKDLEIGEEGTQALLSALKANTRVSLKISKANCTEEQQAEKEKYGTRFEETF